MTYNKQLLMKKLLLFLVSACLGFGAAAQCTADYAFGDVGFGVSPDPNLGESFEIGVVGEAYEDIIHMLVPTSAGDVDTTYADITAPIDSLTLVSVDVVIGLDTVDISTIGLTPTCNNLDDSPDPCTFMGGEQYCALLSGTPTMAGEFPLIINVEGYIWIFPAIPVSFDQYSLTIEASNNIAINNTNAFDVAQNTPNPCRAKTSIQVTAESAGEMNFVITNLLGDRVHEEKLMVNRGQNIIQYDASELRSGIYLYSLDNGGHKITKRMVISE